MGTKRRRKVANPLALAALALLAERPMHPYEMNRTLRERKKEESIKLNYGSLYMVVDQLARAEFIEASATVREGQRPERTVYSLTEAGRAELRDWLRELLAIPQKEYRQFDAALALVAVLPPDEVVALLTQRVRQLTEQNRELRAAIDVEVDGGLDRLFVAESEYRLALAEAEQRWVKTLIRRIRGDPSFGQFWRQFHAEAQA